MHDMGYAIATSVALLAARCPAPAADARRQAAGRTRARLVDPRLALALLRKRRRLARGTLEGLPSPVHGLAPPTAVQLLRQLATGTAVLVETVETVVLSRSPVVAVAGRRHTWAGPR